MPVELFPPWSNCWQVQISLESPILCASKIVPAMITLDANCQAIGTSFVSEVVEMPDGYPATKMVAMRENVNQTLGIDPVALAAIGLPAREVPKCERAEHLQQQ